MQWSERKSRLSKLLSLVQKQLQKYNIRDFLTIGMWLWTHNAMKQGFCRLICTWHVTTLAKYSRLSWWSVPVPGGTTVMFLKAASTHFKKANLSLFFSISTFWFLSSVLAQWDMCWWKGQILSCTGRPGLSLGGADLSTELPELEGLESIGQVWSQTRFYSVASYNQR